MDFTIGYDSGNAPSYEASFLTSGQMIQFRADSADGLKIVLTIRYDVILIRYFVDDEELEGRAEQSQRYCSAVLHVGLV